MRHNIMIVRKNSMFSKGTGFMVTAIFLFLVIAPCGSSLFAEKKKKAKPVTTEKVETVAEARDVADKEEKVDGEKESQVPDDKKVQAKEEPGIPGVTGKEYSENDFKPKAEEESYAWMVIKMILILGAMVGIFYYFFQFVTKKVGITIQGEDVVRILSVVPVGQNKFIQVVDLAGKILVLGVADNGINLITEVTNKDEIDRIRVLGSRSKPVPEGGFQEYVKTQIGRVIDRINDRYEQKKHPGDLPHGESGVDLDYLKRQKKRLKRMNGFGDE